MKNLVILIYRNSILTMNFTANVTRSTFDKKLLNTPAVREKFSDNSDSDSEDSEFSNEDSDSDGE